MHKNYRKNTHGVSALSPSTSSMLSSSLLLFLFLLNIIIIVINVTSEDILTSDIFI